MKKAQDHSKCKRIMIIKTFTGELEIRFVRHIIKPPNYN